MVELVAPAALLLPLLLPLLLEPMVVVVVRVTWQDGVVVVMIVVAVLGALPAFVDSLVIRSSLPSHHCL